jgi:vacuolar protein sorting-associated protein 54
LKSGQLELTPLSTIPSVYFDSNFRLENPRVFDRVIEHTAVVRQHCSTPVAKDTGRDSNRTASDDMSQPARKALSTNAMLQEKLSWYMDTVECHFVSSIAQVLVPFFAALGSLQDLQAEAAESAEKIITLRNHLAYVNKNMAVLNLEIMRERQRRENLNILSHAVIQLQYIRAGAMHCEELVHSGQLATAMQCISCVEMLACGIRPPHLTEEMLQLIPNPHIGLADLRRLRTLEGLLQGMSLLRLRIGEGYGAQLMNILLSDLREHISRVPSKDTLARWMSTKVSAHSPSSGSSSGPAHITGIEKLRANLLPVLDGLGQTECFAAASSTFRQAVIQEMTLILRQHLPSSTEHDNGSVTSVSTRGSSQRLTEQERASTISRNLRALGPEDAATFFTTVFCRVSEALRRLGVQVKVLLDLVSRMEKAPSRVLKSSQLGNYAEFSAVRSPDDRKASSTQQDMMQALDMSTLLEEAVDKVQSEIVKVLRLRTEPTTSLGMARFLHYFTLNRLFVNECEAVSGHSGMTFRNVINDQFHRFVTRFHETERQRLAQKMESEKWERIDFNNEDAMALARVLQSATCDPQAWLNYMRFDIESTGASEQIPQSNDVSVDHTGTKTHAKKGMILAAIDQETFMTVESVAFALRGIEQYAILLVSVPNMANAISTALLDYLKLFNSRTQQLILGAGAKLTAGLTTINTKHLALASQSLSLFITLIPYIRGCVSRHSTITVAGLAEYSRLERVFQEHQSFIHNKFIDIMGSRAAACIRAMGKVEWDHASELQGNVSPHVETLVTETLTLKRVLNKFLPPSSVDRVITRVFDNYRNQFLTAFDSAAVKTELGRAR